MGFPKPKFPIKPPGGGMPPHLVPSTPKPAAPPDLEIVAINVATDAGWFSSGFWYDEIEFTSASDLVAQVLARSKGRKVRRLRIMDHGEYSAASGGLVDFGTDTVAGWNFKTYESTFRLLRPCFGAGAVVHLMHCYVGNDTDLMNQFVAAFNCDVLAGLGMTNGALNTNFGGYQYFTRTGVSYGSPYL